MPSPKPLRRPGYRLETIDDELLLFHPAKTQVLYCNQTASVIWQLCDGQRTIQEIVSLLSDAYPESAEEINRDVDAVLQSLRECDALEFV
jgi:coenzyme PQQ biosynthesis protein PqqD